jgi:prolyl-tRNA editing enzyme YbaK/EbsC (Cys-tRNA(Pro) deacylase)
LKQSAHFSAATAPDIEIIETALSSSTVALAAEAHGVDPAQIAKTICLRMADEPILVVASGLARLDNQQVQGCVRRQKDACSVPMRSLPSPAIPSGASARSGFLHLLRIYCDISLKQFDLVVPAAGSTNSAVRISSIDLLKLTNATWVDVCQ